MKKTVLIFDRFGNVPSPRQFDGNISISVGSIHQGGDLQMGKAIEVLLIEDNPADAYLACEYLNDTGFQVSVTKLQDGKAAIDYFEQVHGGIRQMPDLVLLDLNLPKQNGQEVLEFIRRHDKEVRVVIYSGSTSPMDRQRAEASSVNGYLVKPMTGDEMDEVVFQLKKVLKSIDDSTCNCQ
jgi:CheY-like chemotaxis protein